MDNPLKVMAYDLLQPPFSLVFSAQSKRDLHIYSEWFHGILPHRLNVLHEAVTQTPSFESWRPDLSPSSLDQLGEWFATQVEVRSRTACELKEIKSRLSFPIDIPDKELTDRTFSLAIDVGMYLSQVFLKNHPVLRWEQKIGAKTHIHYGQPVLSGFGVHAFNPVHHMTILAYGVVSGKESGRSLRQFYDIWSGFVKTPVTGSR